MAVTQTDLLRVYKELEKRIADVDLRQGGPRGPKGRKGDKGDIGPVGPAGPKGTTGDAGRRGPQGLQGPTGPAGRAGSDGRPGPAGTNGTNGTDGVDGADGVGIADAKIDFDGHLTLFLTDGTELDAGSVGWDDRIEQIVYNAGGGVPDELKKQIQDIEDTLNDHLADFNNPHQTTHANLTDNPGNAVWLDNPHETSVENLTDTSILSLVGGHGLWWDEDKQQWINRAAFLESWPTGLASGGELNIGPGVNDIEVIAGLGATIDSYTDPLSPPTALLLSWGQINEPITAAPPVAGSIVWFTIYDTGIAGTPINNVPTNVGALRQYAQPPGPTLGRQEIPLGFAVHNGVAWQEVSNPKVLNQAAETLREVATVVLPLTTIIQGGTVTEQPSFMLDQEAGTVWENNRNWHVDKSDPNREALPAASPMTFEYVNRDFTVVGAPTNTVDPSIWDNGGVVEPVPGGSAVSTIQRVYLDPANNYWILLGQTTYPNFLTAQANLPADNVEVPFLLENSILLGYIVSEKSKTDWDPDESVFVAAGSGSGGSGGGGTPITDHDNLNGITPDNHHRQAHPLFGNDLDGFQQHTDINTSVPMAETQGLFWATSEFIPAYRNKYIPDYTIGPTYYPQEWVANPSYLSIANTVTTDDAFPQNVGTEVRTYPDVPPFATAQNNSLVRSGHQYTFSSPGNILAIWVWVPEITVDTRYSLVSIVDPNGSPKITRKDIDPASITANQWNLIAADSGLATTGAELLIYLESQNFGSTTQVTGGWIYGGQENVAAPATSSWNRNNANSILRIDKTDLDTTDRTTELLGIIPGSTIQFVDTVTPTNTVSYFTLATPVDQGTYIEYSVSLQSVAGVIGEGDATTMTADIPVSQPAKFDFQTDKWLTDTPTWATIQSFLQYDDVTQPVDANLGYGIDITFQELSQSADWDLIPLGGGGGGGGGDFTPSTFTGAGTTGYVPDPVTESGRHLADDGTWVAPPTVITDHGALGGLADDDHPQYHTDARGDARYFLRDNDTIDGGTY